MSSCIIYGMEACPLRKSQLMSLDFAVNSALRKIFDTKSQDIVNECREIFNCLLQKVMQHICCQ